MNENDPRPSDDALNRLEEVLSVYRDVTAEVTQAQRQQLADLWDLQQAQAALPNRESLGDPQEIAAWADLQNFLTDIEREPEPAEEPEPLPPGPPSADLQQVLSQFDQVLQQLEQQNQFAPSVHAEPVEVPIPEPQTAPESLLPPEPDTDSPEQPEAPGRPQEPLDLQEPRSLLGELWQGISDAVEIVPNWLDEVLPDLTGPWVDELLSGVGGWVGSFFGSGESTDSPEPEATEPPAEAREASWWQEIPEVQREPVVLPEPELAAEEPVLPSAPLPETAQKEEEPVAGANLPDVEAPTEENQTEQLERLALATVERSREDKQELLANAVLLAQQGSAALLATFPEPEPWDDDEAGAESQEEEPSEIERIAFATVERARQDKEILATLAALAQVRSEETALPEVEGVEPLAEIPEPLAEEVEEAAEVERDEEPSLQSAEGGLTGEVLGEISEGIGTLVELMREMVQERGVESSAPSERPPWLGEEGPGGHRGYEPPAVPGGSSPSLPWTWSWRGKAGAAEETGE